MKSPIILLSAIGLVSCAQPIEAPVVAEEPKAQPKKRAVAPVAVTAAAPAPLPSPAEDGLRMPDMLELPGEERLRPATPAPSREATVITRPPAE